MFSYSRNIRGVNDLIKDKKYGYLIKDDFIKKSVIYINDLSSDRKKLIKFKKHISEINFKNFQKKQFHLK